MINHGCAQQLMMSSRRKQSNPRSLKDVDEADQPSKFGKEQDGGEDQKDQHSEEGAEVSSDHPNHDCAESQKQTGSHDESSDVDVDTPPTPPGAVSREFPYACSYCDKAFSKFSYVRDHELIHSEDMPYQCEFCQRHFRHKRSRDRHMKLHTGDKNYKCSLCDAAFSRSDHLKNHMKSHSNGRWPPSGQISGKETEQTNGNPPPDSSSDGQTANVPGKSSNSQHECQLCKETFSNYYALDEHLKSHAQFMPQRSADCQTNGTTLRGKPLEYHCTHCAKQSLKQVFASLPALEQHVIHMHTGKGLSLLSCPHCDAAFPTVPTLNGHIEREHPKSTSKATTTEAAATNTMACVQKTSAKDAAYAGDVDIKSADATPVDGLSCALCKKPFANPAEVIAHILTEHGAPTAPPRPTSESKASDSSTPLDLSSRSPSTSPVVCSVCGDSVGSLALLIEHNQTHHREISKSKCNVCSEVVFSPNQHLDHMEQHYLTTRRHYLCRCCKKSFSLVDELQNHLITEHSRKIFNCVLCNDMFHTEVDLKIHLTVEHSNESKTYKCACCGQGFEDIVSWRAHMLHMHIDLVLPSAAGIANSKKETLIQCPYCIKSFRTEAEVNIHVLSHQKAFQCTLCDERFAVEYLRDKHMQNEHSRQSTDSTLQSQANQGTNNDVKQPYFCNVCDRVFHSEDVYEEHKRKSHSAAKVWQQGRQQDRPASISSSAPTSTAVQTKMFSTACDTCGKAFKTYSELDKHSRVHFGPVSLTCVICDLVCSSLADMAKHKLQHCKVPNVKPCIVCHTEVKDMEAYMKHCHHHIEADSTVICCVCKHRITSQVELDFHAEFHFPKNPTLSCASCKKRCPYFIKLPAQLTENPQFLLCQECLVARNQPTNIVLPNRILPLPSTPEMRSPSARQSTSSTSPRSYSRDQKPSLSTIHSSPPPSAVHRCNECNIKYETLEELDSHSCMQKACANCQKPYKISELVCKLDSYICTTCDSMPKDLWKCDKCKLTFTREEKYQKHNCIALGDGKACSMCQGRFNHSQLLLRGSKLVCKSCDKKLTTCRLCAEVYAQNDLHRCRLRCESCREMFTASSQSMDQSALCNLCVDKQTESTFEYKNRLSTKTAKDKVYQCIKCQKTCESENEIKIHVLTYHMNEKTHKCYLCGTVFSTPAKLQAHLIGHNFGFADRMSCPKCDWTTSEAAALIGHCTSEHSVTNRSFVCSFCFQSFFFEAELVNHTSSHHSSVANLYKSTASPIGQLMNRKRRNSNEKVADLPSKVRVVKSETFSDNDDNDELFCSKCDLEFVSLEQYNIHLNLHHRDTLVRCSWCARLYCSQEDLKEHITTCFREKARRHSDEVFTNGVTNGKAATYSRENSDASTSSYNSRLQSQGSSPRNSRSKTCNSDVDERDAMDAGIY